MHTNGGRAMWETGDEPGVFTVAGVLDASAAETFRLAVLRQGADDGRVDLDLGGVEEIDVAALATLLSIRRQLALDGVPVRIARTSDPVRRLVEQTGMRRVLLAA